MILAYSDESGDTGLNNSPTSHFVISSFTLADSEWLNALNVLCQLRRNLRTSYGIPTRQELKSRDFARGSGPLSGLGWSRAQRFDLMGRILQDVAASLPIQAFSVAVEKAGSNARGWHPRLSAWTFTLQRFDRHAADAGSNLILFPDEGNGAFIRELLRKVRRNQVIRGHYGGTLPTPVQRIIEDPNDRQSHNSYFIQLADWMAYAAHRSRYVSPQRNTPCDLWDHLGPVHLQAVNQLRGGPPGIVLYP